MPHLPVKKAYDPFFAAGIVTVVDGVPFVVHADPSEGRVIEERWDRFLDPEKTSGGVLYRLRNDSTFAANPASAIAQQYYHQRLSFDDDFDLATADRLYCTELILRAYRSVGVDLCKDAETAHPHLLPADLIHSVDIVEVLRF